jgi:hypothetical protein
VPDPGRCSCCMRLLAGRVKVVNRKPAQVLEACQRCREAGTPEGREKAGLLEECRHGGYWSP